MQEFLIEFWDRDNKENIVPLLHRRYDGAIYFFLKESSPTFSESKTLTDFMFSRYGFKPLFVELKDPSLPAISQVFLETVLDHPGCHFDFDITGGYEVFSAAVGYFLRSVPGDNVSVVLYNVYRDELTFTTRKDPESGEENGLLFSEFVSLSGGSVLSMDEGGKLNYQNPKYRKEVLDLYGSIRFCFNEWNRFLSLSSDTSSEDGRNVFLRKASKKADIQSARAVLAQLKRDGLASYSESVSPESVLFRYRMTRYSGKKQIWNKGGSALEQYAHLAAEETGLFRDVHSEVILDWDKNNAKTETNPQNEIDLVMMAKNTPVFVSCKNSLPTKDYLYEILVIARHFGGKYAIPALFCSEKAPMSVKERAKESGVVLVDGIARISYGEFKTLLAERFEEMFSRIRYPSV